MKFVLGAPLALLCTGLSNPVFGQTPPPPRTATTAETQGALVRWQSALDQLALGRKTEARVLLEHARAQYGDAPEINMLLAWLAEQNGQSPAPFLAPVEKRSPLAAAWPAVAPPTVHGSGANALPGTNPAATVTDNTFPTTAAAAVFVTTQPDSRLAALEAYMVNRVNEERRARKLRPLTTDSLLADTARAHAAEMRDLAYFAHTSPTPALAQPLDRYRLAFRQTPAFVAENIYRSWGSRRRLGETEVEEGHKALMKSPGHYANIVTPDAARIGIGIVVNANGDLWVTQMFSRG